MPKNNEWAIPKNIDKPVETVYEIKNEYKVPCYEEFMKDYKVDKKVEDSYKGEFTERDKVPSYGPGGSQSSYSDNRDESRRGRHLGKAFVGFASGTATRIAGPAPSLITGAVAKTVGEIGHALSSDDEWKDAWKYTSELGEDMAKGVIIGQIVGTAIAPAFESSSSALVREGWTLWQEFQDKGGWDKSMMEFHKYHRAAGKDYCSCCDVCKS